MLRMDIRVEDKIGKKLDKIRGKASRSAAISTLIDNAGGYQQEAIRLLASIDSKLDYLQPKSVNKKETVQEVETMSFNPFLKRQEDKTLKSAVLDILTGYHSHDIISTEDFLSLMIRLGLSAVGDSKGAKQAMDRFVPLSVEELEQVAQEIEQKLLRL